MNAPGTENDLVSKLKPEELAVANFRLDAVSPNDGKYAQPDLSGYLSARAEWLACAHVQAVLLRKRHEFGQASLEDVVAVEEAVKKVDPLNMALLEDKVTKHDQLAVLAEIQRFVPARVAALLHPGTTSYDILDTARSYLLKKAWVEKMAPAMRGMVSSLADVAETMLAPDADGNVPLQVGRTHLQYTSPVPFGATLAGFAKRLAERYAKCDAAFAGLKGKVSGIVGTQSSVAMVVGRENALRFEKEALAALGLEPDYAATQIVQKEALADVGHALVSFMRVLGDFANDMRYLYSSDVGEITSRDAKARLGGSSADAGKNNPINWENVAGKAAVVEAGMRVLYEMVQTDQQRDLRGSVQARYEPANMMAETYESVKRAARELKVLSINPDRMAANLAKVRRSPTEAAVAILRGEPGWAHSVHGVGHDFVKTMAKDAQKSGKGLAETMLADAEFAALFATLPEEKRRILQGEIQLYVGTSLERAAINLKDVRKAVAG